MTMQGRLFISMCFFVGEAFVGFLDERERNR